MKTIIILLALVLPAVFLASCKENLSNLKMVQEQATGNFKVSVLSDDGTIKKGQGSFVVEFRNMSDSELAKVGSVSCQSQMQMRGTPMIGESSIDFTDIPGRYNVKYNFPMQGTWVFIIYFNQGLVVQFMLNVI